MAAPAALTEAGGDKVLHLVHDVGGTTTPGWARGVRPRTINGDIYLYTGIATHADGDAFTAGDPVVLNGVWESGSPGTVRKMAGDSGGRIITRPLGVYNNGGTNAFGHPHLVGGAALNGEQAGWLGVGSHADAATWVASGGVLVGAGVDNTTVRKFKVDGAGRLTTSDDFTFGGTSHVDVAAGPNRAQLSANQACRAVIVKADKGNLNTLYLGGSGVTANETSGTGGLQLEPGEATPLIKVTNLNLLYIHGTAGQGASLMWFS